MSRSLRFAVVLILSACTAASAGVVERLSPALNLAGSPVPVLSISMSGPASASFTPSLVGVMNAPLLSAPAPVLLPAPALAAAPLPAPARANRERGPPTARDAGFSAFVAHSVAEKVRSWAVPVEDIFSDHDALLVGENHGSLSSVDTLTREMPRLAAAGVTVIGIEGLKRPQQGAVDDFISGRRANIPDEALYFSPKRFQAFRGLLESARVHGVRVVALGLPLDGWAKAAAELAARKTGRPV